MDKIDPNAPAQAGFWANEWHQGLTIRAELAKAAMIGLCANDKIMEGAALAGGKDLSLVARIVCKMAITHADMLLAELNREGDK